MKSRKQGFTLIELLVVIAIIAVLMAILMPALQRVKKQAATAACLSQLKQWALAFAMYCDDNDNNFFTGEVNGTRDNVGSGRFWRMTMAPYAKDEKMWLCPQATKPVPSGTIPKGLWSHIAWQHSSIRNEPEIGSYGLNGWILNIKASKTPVNRNLGWGRGPADAHWGTPAVKNASNVPVFTGSWWVDSWPRENDQPPQDEAGPSG